MEDPSEPQTSAWAWRLNRELDQGLDEPVSEEEFLEARLEELEVFGSPDSDLYWLILARLAELGLYFAARHARAGRLSRVGDLMFNPREIMVHIRGQNRPVRKNRHQAMTEQFQDRAGESDVVTWLKYNTINEIAKKPIVMVLIEAIEAGGRLNGDRLRSLKAEARNIADSVNLFSSFAADPDGVGFWDDEFFQSRLPRLGRERFLSLGREIESLLLSSVF